MTFKPMLAGTAKDLEHLRYPLIASPKIDGIRCVVLDGRAVSRTLKPIPNEFVRGQVEWAAENGMDGELLSGTSFQACTSAIMSIKGEPEFSFWVFDFIGDASSHSTPYHQRIWHLEKSVERCASPRIQAVPTKVIVSREELEAYESECLERGFEGIMLRDPEGPYKFGRSTEREGYLLKLKRFVDFEASIIGYEEMMHNANEATKDNLGHTKRSSAKAGMVPKGTLGKLLLRRLSDGCEFGCGAGLDDETRRQIWCERERLLGTVVKVKSQPYGEKDAPRLPVFLGWRHEEDR